MASLDSPTSGGSASAPDSDPGLRIEIHRAERLVALWTRWERSFPSPRYVHEGDWVDLRPPPDPPPVDELRDYYFFRALRGPDAPANELRISRAAIDQLSDADLANAVELAIVYVAVRPGVPYLVRLERPIVIEIAHREPPKGDDVVWE